MSALLVGGILSELGLFTVVSSGVTEVVGSTVLGNLAAGAVVGSIAQNVGGRIDSKLFKAGESVLGPNFEKTASRSAKFLSTAQFGPTSGGIQFTKETHRPTDDEVLDSILSPGQKGDLAGKFVVDLASKVAEQAMAGEIINTDLLVFDQHPYITNEVIPFVTNNLPVLKKETVYDGYRGGVPMTIPDSCFEFFDSELSLKYFVLIDELGSHQTLYQTTGVIIPALHGNFLGARSPNNFLPIDIVDLMCAFHDFSYINGPSKVGDEQLVSRLKSRYETLTDEEKPWARFTIAYFSTISKLVTAVLGSTEPTITEFPQVISTTDDLFHAGGDPDGVLIGDLQIQKLDFHQAFSESVTKHSLQSSVMSSVSSRGSSLALSQAFGNIMVQLN